MLSTIILNKTFKHQIKEIQISTLTVFLQERKWRHTAPFPVQSFSIFQSNMSVIKNDINILEISQTNATEL